MKEDVPVTQPGGHSRPQPTNALTSVRSPRRPRDTGRLLHASLPREEAIRRLEGLNLFSRLVAESNRNPRTLTQAVARMSAAMLGDMSVITLLNIDNETYHIAAYHDPDPQVVRLFEQTLEETVSIPRDQGWVAQVIKTGKPLIRPGITLEEVIPSAVPSFIEFTRTVGIAGLLIVPINGRGGVLGAISLTRHAGGRPYSSNDQEFLGMIADRLGIALENDQLIDSLRQELSGRLLAKQALAASEQRFLSLFHATTLGLTVMDLVGAILETNPSFRRLTGYDEANLIAMQFHDLVHPDDVATVLDALNRLRVGPEPDVRIQHRMIRRDGSLVWAQTTFAGVRNGAADSALSLVYGITEDFTARKDAEAELLELKEYLQRGIELERLRLAQNLHDTPLQELYAVIYKLEEVRLKVDPASADVLGGLVVDIQKTLNSLRVTASELRPPSLSRFGLEKAIRSYVQDFRERHPELHLTLALAHDHELLPEPVRLVLFRVFQEALANIVRHAHATEVQIRFSFDAEEARLEISDNGRGFTIPSSWMEVVRNGHYGLAGISERVRAAGGSLVVDSSPGASTTIRTIIPCAPA